VPWFVHRDERGQWDFRAVNRARLRIALLERRCWVCGGALGANAPAAFLIDPICLVNRISAEPPSHDECARFAVCACPHLSNSRTRRNEDRIAGDVATNGAAIQLNPGVVALWRTRVWSQTPEGFVLFGDLLARRKKPEWFAEGRTAKSQEVWASFETGLPFLRSEVNEETTEEGHLAVAHELEAAIRSARRFLPPRLNL